MKKINLPTIMNEILNVFLNRYINTSQMIVISILLLKIAQMITAKRVRYKEHAKIDFPNYYTIVLLSSGGGKDRISDEYDNLIFKPFRQWFDKKAEQYYLEKKQQIQKEYTDKNNKPIKQLIKEAEKTLRYPVLEVCDGTQEGLFEDAKTLKDAAFGAITYKMSEFGMFLDSAQNTEKQFLTCLFDGYNGNIVSKSIKYGKRESSINGIPVNCLFFSDPTLFAGGNLKHMFNLLMQTGLGRRCVISFQKRQKKIIEYDNEIAFRKELQFYEDCKRLSKQLFEIFNRIPASAVYEFTESALKCIHHTYKVRMEELENATEDVLRQNEIQSRQHKAIKIACLYACLNHPTELTINDEDMQQAIDTIEFISQDFEKFRNYKPKSDDVYDKLWEFFKDNLGKGYTKSELVYKYFQTFGIPRDKFKDRFDDYIESIKEIAIENGYMLRSESINRNSGTKYTLIKLEEQELSEDTQSLDDLI